MATQAYGDTRVRVKRDEDEEERRRVIAGLICCCCLLGALIALLIVLTTAPSNGDTPSTTSLPMATTSSNGVTSPATTSVSMTTTPEATPFCCSHDPLVGIDSDYVSVNRTLCSVNYDYNCDGVDDNLACCGEPLDNPELFGNRIVYLRSQCLPAGEPIADDAYCGACTGPDTVVPGWACSEPLSRKRFMPECTGPCAGQPLAHVTPPGTSGLGPPNPGQCALFVTHCVGTHGGDGETCCMAAKQ